MSIQLNRIRDRLRQFDFARLFIEELGWSQPTSKQPVLFDVRDQQFSRQQIAQLAGVVVFEVTGENGSIPDAKTRGDIHKEVAKHHHENVLVFLDRAHTQSLWYWVKRQNGKSYPREYLYIQGQPGDLFVSKLGQMVFDITEFDEEGNVSLVEVASRVRAALDIERVTKKFFGDFQQQHVAFLELISGVPDQRQRWWYASVLLNRLMFIYFLQKKGFLDNGDLNYLQNKLAWSQTQERNQFFRGFLKCLFFEGFARPAEKRSSAARQLLGSIRYLNGGLFLPHKVEEENSELDVPDQAFENLFALFDSYSWNLDDTPGGQDDEINPHVLGYIFEKYINQKSFGAYYTRPEITEYLCEQTIHKLILDAINTPDSVQQHLPPGLKIRHYATIGDMLLDLDAPLCRRLLHEVLPGLSLLDPACGSGAFLVAAMKTLIDIYAAVIGKIRFLSDRGLSEWLNRTEHDHPSIGYFIKKSIITDNLYGVDVMEEATEIAKLRLFLALVASAQTVDQLEPLPNIDFNIMAGNSLIGLMRVNDAEFEKRDRQQNLFRKSCRQVLDEKNRLIENYRHATAYAEDLTELRHDIEQKKSVAYETLDDILLDEFKALGIKYEQATWDDGKNKAGKSIKRALKPEDIERLQPFHWGFEFDEILNQRGGFDAIITNPPWEIFKPNGKEFFEDYSDLVSKKKMSIHEFEKQRNELLKDDDIRSAWLDYLSQFPHQSAYFRSSPQFQHQSSVVNGKKVGTDINLYKLFVEQCFNLLRDSGRCGIIVPGSIYNDLGAKELRELLFSKTSFDIIIGLSNERFIFESVHHDQKFCLVVFRKGGITKAFTASFRINVREAIGPEQLEEFLHNHESGIRMNVPLVRRLSPESLSIMDFRSQTDISIAEKLARFPLLFEEISGMWKLRLCNEFHMTGDSDLYKTELSRGRLPLYEGKIIHQFDHRWGEPRYWVDEKSARERLLASRTKRIRLSLGKSRRDWKANGEIRLDYESYRLGFRDVGPATNERSMIMTVLPRRVFCPHTMSLEQVYSVRVISDTIDPNYVSISPSERLFICAVMNSFVVDAWLKRSITKHVSFFYVYATPVPRLTDKDPAFASIVERAARLVCTCPEFDDLAKDVGLTGYVNGVVDKNEREVIRAELDALIAHLYGLTEEEFHRVLVTFPLTPDPMKVATLNAYRDVERGLIK